MQKKEEKLIRQIKAQITFHEARGGNRPGKVGDKRGQWSPNKEWDEVQNLKAQIALIEANAKNRAWQEGDYKKDLGRNVAKIVKEEAAKIKAAQVAPAPMGSPTSVFVASEFPPALAI
jgi:hypothetical protein